jgi:hypothetical protein
VQTWLEGTPPRRGDWPAVAATLRTLHALTATWPQRPGFASTLELLTADRDGEVDLTQVPADAVAACRRAWTTLAGSPAATCPPTAWPLPVQPPTAWEAANGWIVEPSYARRQLALLQSGKHSFPSSHATSHELDRPAHREGPGKPPGRCRRVSLCVTTRR